MDPGNILVFRTRKIGDDIPRRRSEPPERPARPVSFRVIVMIAAAVVGCLVIGIHNLEAPAPLTVTGSFSTARGQHGCNTAPDTSVVCLNTGTTVRYLLNGHVRHFEVDSGEAAFSVHTENRPLEVGSGRLLIRDIDTRFDVYRKNSSTVVVTVLDGAIKMLARSNEGLGSREPESAWKAAPTFRRLEQIEFDDTTGTLVARRILTERDLSQFMAWQNGEVDLTNKPLSDALQELSRYQPADVTFAYQDKEMRRMRVGGLVGSTHLDDFLVWLEVKHGIQHKQTSGVHGEAVITLSRKRNAEAHRQPH